MNDFTNYHPVVLLIYYIAVLSMTLFLLHPVVLSVSFIGSLLFYGLLTSARKVWKDMRLFMVIFLLIAGTNPLFVHKGETILFYFICMSDQLQKKHWCTVFLLQ